jgi:hypothetical protein
MTPEMSRLLKQFSDAANKSSSGTHSADEKRYYKFIIQSCKENEPLDELELRELLVNDGWTPEQAQSLSSKYSFGRDLLNYYLQTKV